MGVILLGSQQFVVLNICRISDFVLLMGLEYLSMLEMLIEADEDGKIVQTYWSAATTADRSSCRDALSLQ